MKFVFSHMKFEIANLKSSGCVAQMKPDTYRWHWACIYTVRLRTMHRPSGRDNASRSSRRCARWLRPVIAPLARCCPLEGNRCRGNGSAGSIPARTTPGMVRDRDYGLSPCRAEKKIAAF